MVAAQDSTFLTRARSVAKACLRPVLRPFLRRFEALDDQIATLQATEKVLQTEIAKLQHAIGDARDHVASLDEARATVEVRLDATERSLAETRMLYDELLDVISGQNAIARETRRRYDDLERELLHRDRS